MPTDTERLEADETTVTESPEETEELEAPTEDADSAEETDWEAAARAARRDAEKKRKRAEEVEAKLKEIEEEKRKATEKKRKEEGKYEELLAEKEQALAEALMKVDKYDALVEKIREEKLAQLPKKLREKYATVDIELLSDIVADFTEMQQRTAGSLGVDTPNPRASKPESWASLSRHQQEELLRDNPEEARRLIREYGRASAGRK